MPGDILSESFEGSGYENAGWTETEGSGSHVDEDSTDITFQGGGSQVLKLQKVSPNFSARLHRSWGSPYPPDIYASISFELAAEDLTTDVDQLVLVGIDDDVWHWTPHIYIEKVSGILRVSCACEYDGGGHSSAFTPIAVGTKYVLYFRYDRTNKYWEWGINGANVISTAITTPSGAGMMYFYLGDSSLSKTATLYIDRVELSSTGYIYQNFVTEEKICTKPAHFVRRRG